MRPMVPEHKERPADAGLSSDADERTRTSTELPPHGPEPVQCTVFASFGVQNLAICEVRRRAGRAGRDGCCHGVVTDRSLAGRRGGASQPSPAPFACAAPSPARLRACRVRGARSRRGRRRTRVTCSYAANRPPATKWSFQCATPHPPEAAPPRRPGRPEPRIDPDSDSGRSTDRRRERLPGAAPLRDGAPTARPDRPRRVGLLPSRGYRPPLAPDPRPAPSR